MHKDCSFRHLDQAASGHIQDLHFVSIALQLDLGRLEILKIQHSDATPEAMLISNGSHGCNVVKVHIAKVPSADLQLPRHKLLHFCCPSFGPIATT